MTVKGFLGKKNNNNTLLLCRPWYSRISFATLLLLAVVGQFILFPSLDSCIVVAKIMGSSSSSSRYHRSRWYNYYHPAIAFTSPEIPRQVAQKVHPSVALLSPIVGVRNMTSQGSGFVVELFGNEEEGEQVRNVRTKFDLYVLTAAHVVSPGKRIQVSFPCHTSNIKNNNNNTYSYSASVIARDWNTDLALLGLTATLCSSKGDKEEAKHNHSPPPLSLSDQESPEIGRLAFANGYPAGFDGIAMTSGIVCGTAKDPFRRGPRKTNDSNQILESIQGQTAAESATISPCCYVVTDAAMAGGMSGGPLVDIDGAVIGMNSLLRPDLGPLGNYAVTSAECRNFLSSVVSSSRSVISTPTTDAGFTVDERHQVVIFNDPINTRVRVAQVLRDIAQLNATEAEESMLKAHRNGWGVVRIFSTRSDADKLCEALQNEDILAEVHPCPEEKK
jgi:S1-C subfamily serine protease